MKECLRVLRCVSLAIVAAYSQDPLNTPSFEVATVKLAPHEPKGIGPVPDSSLDAMMRFNGGPGTKSPERIDYLGVTLKMLIERAYGVGPSQIVGPGWFDTQRYVVAAKLPKGTTPKTLQLMLQRLLTERFEMSLHHENKRLRVYELTVAKNGPKLEPAEKLRDEKDQAEWMVAAQKKLDAAMAERHAGAGPELSFRLPRSTAQEFAVELSSYVGRPVIDRTRLEGRYAFALRWVPEGAQLPNDAASGPSIFDALKEQLGLRLQPAEDQFDVLVIDKAEKIPTSN